MNLIVKKYADSIFESHEELAHYIGSERKTVCKYINGKVPFAVIRYANFCQAIGITVEDAIREGEKNRLQNRTY